MRRGTALATPAAAARLGPERPAGGYRYPGGAGGSRWPKGTRGPRDRCVDRAARDAGTGAAPPHRPPLLLQPSRPSRVPCHARFSPPWAPSFRPHPPLPSKAPASAPPGTLRRLSRRTPPHPAPAPLSPSRHPHVLSPIRPRTGEGEGTHPAPPGSGWGAWPARALRVLPAEEVRVPPIPAEVAPRMEPRAATRRPGAGGRGRSARTPAPRTAHAAAAPATHTPAPLRSRGRRGEGWNDGKKGGYPPSCPAGAPWAHWASGDGAQGLASVGPGTLPGTLGAGGGVSGLR